MEYSAKMTNDANALVDATILIDDIEKKADKIAAEAAKTMDVQGFRKGKVPKKIVKQRYGDKLNQDAEGEVVRDLLDKAYKELEISADRLIGEPFFKQFDRGDKEIKLQMALGLRPQPELEGYEEVVPSFRKPPVKETEIDKRIDQMAQQHAEMETVKEDRGVQKGDIAVIDFEGFLDGEAFEGGKAEGHNLEVGSGQFIPGFEDQVEGMKAGEEKTIKITFPDDYNAKNLAGKETEFKVKVNEIKQKKEVEVNDELAQKLLQKEDATVDELRDQVKTQIKNEKINEKYRDELKPKLTEALVEKFEFALPEQIVEQEMDMQLNNKARSMSQEEIQELQKDEQKIKDMREELRPDATESVKATFIVDALAKKEEVDVQDQEVTQAIYYEAMMQGQNPKEVLEQYEKQGYLSAVKMAMIEDKLFAKLLKLYD
ncbi:MAG: trigger factor [Campylobacterota bacterium]